MGRQHRFLGRSAQRPSSSGSSSLSSRSTLSTPASSRASSEDSKSLPIPSVDDDLDVEAISEHFAMLGLAQGRSDIDRSIRHKKKKLVELSQLASNSNNAECQMYYLQHNLRASRSSFYSPKHWSWGAHILSYRRKRARITYCMHHNKYKASLPRLTKAFEGAKHVLEQHKLKPKVDDAKAREELKELLGDWEPFKTPQELFEEAQTEFMNATPVWEMEEFNLQRKLAFYETLEKIAMHHASRLARGFTDELPGSFLTLFNSCVFGVDLTGTVIDSPDLTQGQSMREWLKSSYSPGSVEVVWDPVLGRNVSEELVAERLFFPCHCAKVMDAIFGADRQVDAFTDLNGILVHQKVRHAMQKGQMIIVPDIKLRRPGTEKSRNQMRKDWERDEFRPYKILVLDNHAENMVREDWNEELYGIKALVDLHEQPIQFAGSRRPHPAYIYWAYLDALMRVDAQQNFTDNDVGSGIFEQLVAANRLWEAGGRYIHASQLAYLMDKLRNIGAGKSFTETIISHGFETLHLRKEGSIPTAYTVMETHRLYTSEDQEPLLKHNKGSEGTEERPDNRSNAEAQSPFWYFIEDDFDDIFDTHADYFLGRNHAEYFDVSENNASEEDKVDAHKGSTGASVTESELSGESEESKRENKAKETVGAKAEGQRPWSQLVELWQQELEEAREEAACI